MKQRFKPNPESLEARDCPSIDLQFDVLGNLRITDFSSPSSLTITIDATNSIRVEDGANTAVEGIPLTGNLSISTGPDADTVSVILDGGALFGDLSINTGYGDDTVSVVGTVPGSPIDGRVTFTGTNQPNALMQTFSNVAIGGNVTIQNRMENLATQVSFFNSSIGGQLSYYGGNSLFPINDTIGLVLSSVGGNVYTDFGGGTNVFTLGSSSVIGNNFSYKGGSEVDLVDISGIVGGSVRVSLGNSPELGFNSMVFSGIVGGNLTVLGGSGFDSWGLFTGVVGGSVYANLGDGDNLLNFDGTVNGRSFVYVGGIGQDAVTFGFTAIAGHARTMVSLGLGNDTFILQTSVIRSLFADFGFGDDTFFNTIGSSFPFYTILRNLP